MPDLSLRLYMELKEAIPNHGVRWCVPGAKQISLRSLLTPVTRIIHISDTHFTDKNETISSGGWSWIPVPHIEHRYQNSTLKACKLENFFMKNRGQLGTSIIICTGDLTNDGDQRGYERWQKFSENLKAMGYTILIVPGNHDYCENGWLDYHIFAGVDCGGKSEAKRDRFIELVGYSGYPHVEIFGNCIFILLDSMKGEMDDSDPACWAEGRLGVQQRTDLNSLLAKYQPYRKSGARIIVALHHNPIVTNIQGPDEDGFLGYRGRLEDKQEFLNIISNKIDCLLFGHSGDQQKCFNDIVFNGFYQQRIGSLDIGDGINVNPEYMYGIPIINLENLENMPDNSETEFKISVIDMSLNTVGVYETGSTSVIPKSGTTPEKGYIYITPPVNRSYPSVYDNIDLSPAILFQSFDEVTIKIGGGVQTGGTGWGTWHRYVNPNNDKYCGTIYIPGITLCGLEPIGRLIYRGLGQYDNEERGECTLHFILPNIDGLAITDRYLKLGYEDDNNIDNCYDRHDNGEDDQCKGVGPAYLHIKEIRKHEKTGPTPTAPSNLRGEMRIIANDEGYYTNVTIISWDGCPDAFTYDAERQIGESDYCWFETVYGDLFPNNTFFIEFIDNSSEAQISNYRVRAYNANGYGPYSDVLLAENIR